MPTISLRLTDEEAEQLRRWAFEGKRSLQKEIVFRLFAERPYVTVTDSTAPVEVVTGTEIVEVPGQTAIPVAPTPLRVMPDKEFRGPDPKVKK